MKGAAGAEDDLLDGGEGEVVGAGGLDSTRILEGGDELLDGSLAVAGQLLGDGAHGVGADLAGVGGGEHAAGHLELAAVDRVDEAAGAVLGAGGPAGRRCRAAGRSASIWAASAMGIA
jgi:hypothetical protein